MRLFRMCFVFLLVIVAEGVSAQNEVPLNRFRVVTRTGTTDGVEGILLESELKGKSLTGEDLIIPRTEIRNLYAFKGTMAGNYALKGAGIGLLASLLGVLSAYEEESSNPYSEVDDNRVMPIVAGFTAGGALIGAMVGSGKKVLERVPLKAEPRVSVRPGDVKLSLAWRF